jgi:uncharacterized repeat protein (TIGR03803 family)
MLSIQVNGCGEWSSHLEYCLATPDLTNYQQEVLDRLPRNRWSRCMNFAKSSWTRISAVLIAFGVLVGAAAAATTTVIYSFAGDDDGEYADTDLALDNAGNIYGTTVSGGDFGSGTVWQLTLSGNGWSHAVIYSFTSGTDGGEPYKGVTVDASGNLYGTTVSGGSGSCEGGCGVAYKVTNSGGTWTYSVIHAFTGGNDGSGPGARVTLDGQGNVYGMTPTGGAYGLGTIYQLHPRANGGYAVKVIHAFTGGADGSGGSAGKMILRNGRLYGAATAGGVNGSGTVFALTPTTRGEWEFSTLYAFKGQPDAGFPYGALIFDHSGNLYGTTYYDGANDVGAVYELSPSSAGAWSEKVLYSFKGGRDGNSSISNMVSDAAGNLFGTTSEGGTGKGTIFELIPGQNGNWSESLPHIFQGPPDGAFPYNGMVSNGAGSFYGATVHGGVNDEGAVYQFTP